MEKTNKELEVFSAILIEQYIRLMTAAVYHRSEKQIIGADFKISPENYAKMRQDASQTSLLGLELTYNEEQNILHATPDAEFLEEFENNIMRDVALKFYDTNMHRYKSYILLQEKNPPH